LIILTLITKNLVFGQDERSNFFGINPSFTVEPYYDSGEFDFNIFPLVYQRSISNRIDLRLASTINYGISNGDDKLSHIGMEVGAPIFLKKKETVSELSKGFYFSTFIKHFKS
jgi:hypothetical protein